MNAPLLCLLVLAAPPPGAVGPATVGPAVVRGQDPGWSAASGQPAYFVTDGVMTEVMPGTVTPGTTAIETQYGSPSDVFLPAATVCPAVPCGPPLCPPACKPPACDECGLTHEVFFDYLFLSATGADLVYAVPVDGIFAPQVLAGTAARVDGDFDSGFRVGGTYALDRENGLTFTYWRFDSTSSDRASLTGGPGGGPAGPPAFLQATLVDPNTLNVAADSLAARATQDIDFRIADFEFRRLVYSGQELCVFLLVGARYGELDQQALAVYDILGQTTVGSNLDFDGVGPRLGLDGQWHAEHGFLLYGRSGANLLVGNVQADFAQQNIFAGRQSFLSLEDDRIVPVLEFEAGVGWESPNDRLRLLAGYYVGGWFNMVTNRSFVDAVQARDFNDLSDTITFNGLTTRLELRF